MVNGLQSDHSESCRADFSGLDLGCLDATEPGERVAQSTETTFRMSAQPLL